MKFKMRKIKSWLRWAKRRYEEKYGIKIQKMTFPKSQLKMALKAQNAIKKQEIKCAGEVVRIKKLKVRIKENG